MLKYLKVQEVFREIPGEISLGLSISGCKIHCPECNQKELWKDAGRPLDIEELQRLLEEHRGITCLLLLGGEHDIDGLTELFMFAHKRVKTAWYSGLDMIPKKKNGIVRFLDYLKLGHYDPSLGGLDSPYTNQRLFEIVHTADERFHGNDITYKLQKKNEN